MKITSAQTWVQGDFADGSQNILGTVYTDDTLSTAFNLTGYTLELEFWDNVKNWLVKNNLTGTIVVAGSGTFKFVATEGDLNFKFEGEIRLKLTKSGTELTAIGVTGSADFMIEEDV